MSLIKDKGLAQDGWRKIQWVLRSYARIEYYRKRIY